MADPLHEGGYPALHDAANSASLDGQGQFLVALVLRLGGLLFAAVGGGILLAFGLTAVAGWTALFGFLTALLAELYTAIWKPDRRWYEGRAAAESAKTLAWRYGVRGESFDYDDGVDKEFANRIREILDDLRDVDLAGSTTASDQITPEMRRIRGLGFDDRKHVYELGRIEDQRSWYDGKAAWNRKRQHRWSLVVFAAQGMGVVGGVLLIAEIVAMDLLGVFAALAATVTAWVQAKQHSNLATAYGITAQELATIKSEVGSVPETQWAEFVGQAEEAISREHTLWRASRGLRMPRRLCSGCRATV